MCHCPLSLVTLGYPILSEHHTDKNTLLCPMTPYSKAKQTLFMVHPGNSGSEIYAPLAKALSDHFNCIGIDNYNFTASFPMGSLQMLAEIYVKMILNEIDFNLNAPIYLLGWSLDGRLAMEMAYQLEKWGARKIKIYLIDVILLSTSLER